MYRYAPEKVVDSLKAKVARLHGSAIFNQSNTLIRALARDGLMEDGKDKLLERQLVHSFGLRCMLIMYYDSGTTEGGL